MNKNIQYKKLTDICEIITGEWGTEITENSQNIVSVIRTTNFLNNGKIDIQNKELIKREIDKKKIEQKQLKRGDIIIEKSGGSPNQPVGRVVFFDLNSNEVFLCNNFTSILRVKEDINSKYIFYFLRNNYKKNKVVKYQNKTTGIINLKLQNYLNESCIFLPELKIQNKIVNILDNLENIIEKNQNYLTHLGVLIKSLFTTMFGDIKTNDKNWEIKKFHEIISILTDYHANGSYKILKDNVELLDFKEYALMIRTTDLENNNFIQGVKYINEKAYNFLKKTKIFGGELIINKIGSAGNVYLMPYLNIPVSLGMNQFMIRLKKDYSNIFYYKLLTTEYYTNVIKSNVQGAVTKTITKEAIKNIDIIIPPIELQNKFAERIEKIEKLKFEIEKSIEIAQNLYDSLISKYFDN
ncbi:restriction endonuclease subunit S [Fusobacterium pseudoperiodonticum]